MCLTNHQLFAKHKVICETQSLIFIVILKIKIFVLAQHRLRKLLAQPVSLVWYPKVIGSNKKEPRSVEKLNHEQEKLTALEQKVDQGEAILNDDQSASMQKSN